MSTSYSPTVTFHCYNDCRQQGCPGHTLKLAFHHTSDTISVYEDDKHSGTVFDDNQLKAIIAAYDAYTENYSK